MHLISVNVGHETPFKAKRSGKTGIFKQPVEDAIAIGPLGLAGDYIADKRNHGGPDQAVYVFGEPDYAWWSAELGKSIGFGTFGENLTISDLCSAEYTIGDRLAIGNAANGVILEITGARIPCVTLAARMEDNHFIDKFVAAERPGLYCRVIQPGHVRAGDSVTVERFAGDDPVNVLEGFRLFYQRHHTDEQIRRMLANPISIRARRHYEAELRKREYHPE